ncbi:hypothetical protein CAOG_002670 [Capsaspora owczarzaki ATCC 30864]|uniref:Uncharacterized protein n=1 Tax=Capsaspora owczarzaki (strain ATCC 30864) TaxID=595528 RepID=A0A0D2U901_CAPO3|nr:hypothetical protein CAOG_002670 [Capsaspora owczarzaki ATCC 30864]
MEGLQSETTEPSSLRPAADAAAAAAAANANPANVDTAVAMVADGIQFERHSPVAGNTSHPTRLEGFWASSPRIEDDGYHGAYPWPTPSTQPWPRRTDWVGKLRLIQDAFEAAQTTRTTRLDTLDRWNKQACRPAPFSQGLAHYVEVHHILPSLIFYEYVRDFPMNRIRQVLDAAEQKPLTRCGRICCWFQ